MHGYVDVLAVGDSLFLREMNTFAARREGRGRARYRRFTTSQAGVLQDWNRASTGRRATILPGSRRSDRSRSTTPNCGRRQPTDCITQSEDEKLVIQRLPEVRLIAARRATRARPDGRFPGQLSPTFQRGTRPGRRARRLQAAGGVRACRSDPRCSDRSAAPSAETAYGLSENADGGGFTGTEPRRRARSSTCPTSSSREIFELRTAAVRTDSRGSSTFRIFGLDKLKHTVEPRAAHYLYIPNIDQSDLPVWDGDRPYPTSAASSPTASRRRLLGREAADGDGERGAVFELGVCRWRRLRSRRARSRQRR